MATSLDARSRRELLETHAEAIDALMRRYHAVDLRIFGSVARGDATAASDIDLLVDLDPDEGNPLMRVAGLAEELTALLGVRVDVAAPELLRKGVSAGAARDMIRL